MLQQSQDTKSVHGAQGSTGFCVYCMHLCFLRCEKSDDRSVSLTLGCTGGRIIIAHIGSQGNAKNTSAHNHLLLYILSTLSSSLTTPPSRSVMLVFEVTYMSVGSQHNEQRYGSSQILALKAKHKQPPDRRICKQRGDVSQPVRTRLARSLR
jgi:hypothetical protein